jgi:hypothetical protein
MLCQGLSADEGRLTGNSCSNLVASGVLDYPLGRVAGHIEELEIGGAGPYGYNHSWGGWPRRGRA